MKKQLLIIALFFGAVLILAGCQNLGDQISKKWNSGEKAVNIEDQKNQLVEEKIKVEDGQEVKVGNLNQAAVLAEKDLMVVPKDQVNKIFFGSKKYDPEAKNCLAVYWVDIRGNKVDYENMDPVERNIRLLLAGPTEKWVAGGYFTSIPADTKLNSIRAEGNNIYLDFSAELNQGGGSCMMAQRRAQIDATVRAAASEFLGQKIDYVIISVNGGNPEETLQP